MQDTETRTQYWSAAEDRSDNRFCHFRIGYGVRRVWQLNPYSGFTIPLKPFSASCNGMRQFIVLGHSASTTPDFTLKDIPGSAGRMDVLCRCINSAFFLSHGLRENVRVHLVLQDTYTVRIEGREVQYLNPDEYSTGALIQKALEKAQVTDTSDEQRCTPGIYIQEQGFEQLLEKLAEHHSVVQLHEDGAPIGDIELPEHGVYVLSDHEDFTSEEASLLEEYTDQRICVGPNVLHADHTITILQNTLDRQTL